MGTARKTAFAHGKLGVQKAAPELQEQDARLHT